MLGVMHGTYSTVDDRPALTFERRLAHPVEHVWRAVTDPAELAHWFPSAVSGEVAPGGRLTFEFPDDHMPPLEGEVVELEPPRRFAFTWGEDVLRIELEAAGDGCVLRFTCLFDEAERAARDAAGWHVCLELLERHLGGMPTTAPGSEPTPGWRELYEEYQRRGLPAGAPVPGCLTLRRRLRPCR
jgi:uncharacterized protein YndB with AHSA1/START domain